MPRELFKAKESDQDNWITSDSMSWMDGELYLFSENNWIRCEHSTRSISLPSMIDKNGKRIFTTLNKNAQEWVSMFLGESK